MKSQSIDKYLSCGKEQPVNEGTFLSILTGFAIVRCIFCIWGLIQLYLFAVQVKRVSKFNMDLTKKLNKILGTTDHKVYIVPDESVNAFNLNGKTVYIFEGLFKLLTEGETLAILIHEVSHGTNHDAIKQMIKTELTSLVPSSAAASIIISVLGIMPISLVFALIAMKIIYGLSGNYWSRKDEYAADKLAIEKGYGEELANAFKKMLKAYHEPTKKPKKSYLGAIIEKILLFFILQIGHSDADGKDTLFFILQIGRHSVAGK